jgi:magnesium transporter
MSLELEQPQLNEQFEAIIRSEEILQLRDFLNQQNITDVVDLVYEFPEHESQIIASMSVNRAASVFKLLEFPTQKSIIQNLPPNVLRRC